MLRDGASRAPRPLYLLGYICDQPFFLIVVWTWRHSPTHLQCSLHKLHKYALELEWSGGGWGGVEADGVGGGQGWAEKGKGGHTMTSPPSYATTSQSSIASP